MWKQITTNSHRYTIKAGDIISQTPNNFEERYEIQAIDFDFVRAVHCNGKNAITVFPYSDLFIDRWWIKTPEHEISFTSIEAN